MKAQGVISSPTASCWQNPQGDISELPAHGHFLWLPYFSYSVHSKLWQHTGPNRLLFDAMWSPCVPGGTSRSWVCSACTKVLR